MNTGPLYSIPGFGIEESVILESMRDYRLADKCMQKMVGLQCRATDVNAAFQNRLNSSHNLI